MHMLPAGQYVIFAYVGGELREYPLDGKMQPEAVHETETLKGTDTPRIYWEISCFLKERCTHEGDTLHDFSVWKKRISQNSPSLPPSFLFIPSSETLFLGCEEGLFVIDVPSGKVIFEVELFAPFFRFYPYLDMVIALCELELYAFDIFGNLKWEANFPDVLNSLRQKEEILELTDLSGSVYSLDILSGQPVQREQSLPAG